jgi:ATP/maltotriose-dependent transcriptional regulator MalT
MGAVGGLPGRRWWAASGAGRDPWLPWSRPSCGPRRPVRGSCPARPWWGARKGPRTGWVSIDRRDNDPAVLVGYLAATLDRLEPLDPAVFEALASPGVSVLATVLPRFLAAVSALTGPVALVLDNLETLENRVCLDAVAELALGLPAGSQVAIAARARPALPVALLRARGQVVEVGVAELAMNQGEGCALLAAAGAGLADPEAIELVGRTEGWPVGLYLAALANLVLRDRPAAVPVQAHGQDPGHLDLPQARRLLA